MKLVFVIGLMVAAGWSLFRLSREAGRVHDGLSAIRQRAFNAATVDELDACEVSLRVFAAENCWHRHLSAHAREVLAYIQGRRQSWN